MVLFKPKEEHKTHGGIQKIYQFKNGMGASVIKHEASYGGEHGLWELAVLDKARELDYTTKITSDVIGHQTDEDIQGLLLEISKL
jgi:hypothetical protein